ncbi:YafY family transcriptional regulator [Pseudohalocynthiibacter aestuariivivens]|nr:YafY family protein [Pseudohalocynthiibacter aestuariivivens]QIE46784.1 YafY family transcriptional regulator [Pseudohalocynthiibacter aestuariivivens]
MLRTDRLFEVIDLLRQARGPVTARQIAQSIEVSDRTVYRYIAHLQSLRVPIDGAAGVGYILRPGYDLPPLNFDAAEQEALIVGMSLLARTGDAELQRAARRVLAKVETGQTVPGGLGVSDWGIAFDAPQIGSQLRSAIRDEAVLRLTYLSLAGDTTLREVKPLVLTYYVEVAVLSGWCALRSDFRAFRLDRIEALEHTGEHFTGEGATLRAMMSSNNGSG